MAYKLLLVSTGDRRTEYFVKKYLIEELALDGAQAQSLLAALPAIVRESDSCETLEPLRAALAELGASVQINYPDINYCPAHIDQQASGQCQRCQQPLCENCRQTGAEICFNCQQRNLRWRRFTRYRQTAAFCVLIVVVIGAARVYYRDHRKLSWDRTYNVALIEVVKADTNENIKKRKLTAVGRETLVKSLQEWFDQEYTRIKGNGIKPFRFQIVGPVVTQQAPPALPTATDGWWTQYKQTSAFVAFFNNHFQTSGARDEDFDIKIYLYTYPPEEGLDYERQHSVGTTRGRFGVVFIPVDRQPASRVICTIAHEVLHTVGARDKYDETHTTIYPDGYFQPEPRYPQQYAEIMALAKPLAPGKEKDAGWLGEVRVGATTAKEIGW